MTQEEFNKMLKEAIKEHVTVEVERHEVKAYWDYSYTTVKVLFDGEVISEHRSH